MPGTKKPSTYSWSVPVKFPTSAFNTTFCRESAAANWHHTAALPTPTSSTSGRSSQRNTVRMSCTRLASSLRLKVRNIFASRLRGATAAPVWTNRNHHEDHDEIHRGPAQREDCAVRVLDSMHSEVEDFGGEQRHDAVAIDPFEDQFLVDEAAQAKHPGDRLDLVHGGPYHAPQADADRKSTRLNSSHRCISY